MSDYLISSGGDIEHNIIILLNNFLNELFFLFSFILNNNIHKIIGFLG